MVIVEGKIRSKQRPRHNKKGITYTPKQTKDYENYIRSCYMEQDGRWLEGPVEAQIIAYYKIPGSYSKKKRKELTFPIKRPDSDNIIKVILDSLNDRAYKDDSQVYKIIFLKKWTEGIERIEFALRELEEK